MYLLKIYHKDIKDREVCVHIRFESRKEAEEAVEDFKKYYREVTRIEIEEKEKEPLVFDLDDVICYNSVQNGTVDYSQAFCYTVAKEFINRLFDEGYPIRIQTARYMIRHNGDQQQAHLAGYLEGKEWLDRNGVKYTEFYLGKVSGSIYVDDKGYRLNTAKDGREGWEKLYRFIHGEK